MHGGPVGCRLLLTFRLILLRQLLPAQSPFLRTDRDNDAPLPYSDAYRHRLRELRERVAQNHGNDNHVTPEEEQVAAAAIALVAARFLKKLLPRRRRVAVLRGRRLP